MIFFVTLFLLGTFGRVCLATYSFQKTRYFALKILRKATVVRLKQVEHIRNEKLVLEQVTFTLSRV